MLNFEQLIRPNLRALLHVPPVDETLLPKAGALRLDTNANPYDLPFNHDVDRQALSLRRALSSLKHMDVSNVFACNSFAGVVDLCCRCFCVPGEDNVVAAGPTRAVYRQMAQLNGVEYREAALDERFGLSVDEVLGSCDNHTKLVWLCSPNDPTGNLLDVNAVASLLEVFDGMVVVDETYLRFSKSPSWCSVLQRFPNLIVLEQMDAAWGINALNVGMLYASSDIVRLMLAVGGSYALSPVIESKMCGVFSDAFEMDRLVGNVVAERTRMAHALAQLPWHRGLPSRRRSLPERLPENNHRLQVCQQCAALCIKTILSSSLLYVCVGRALTKTFLHNISQHPGLCDCWAFSPH